MKTQDYPATEKLWLSKTRRLLHFPCRTTRRNNGTFNIRIAKGFHLKSFASLCCDYLRAAFTAYAHVQDTIFNTQLFTFCESNFTPL